MTEIDSLWAMLRTAFCVTTVIFVVGGVVRGLQMGSGKRPDLVTGWDYEKLPDVAVAGRSMAKLYLVMSAIMLLLVAQLLSGGRLAVWGILFGLALWAWAYAMGVITERALKRAVER